MKFSIKYFFSKCDQICSFLWIWSHLLKKSFMKNFIFCAMTAKLFNILAKIYDRSFLWKLIMAFPHFRKKISTIHRTVTLCFLKELLKVRINFCSQICTYIWEIWTKNSALQWKIKSLKLSDALKLSPKETKLHKGMHLERSFKNFLGFDYLPGLGGGGCCNIKTISIIWNCQWWSPLITKP